jgi:hypothetical protein
MLTASSNVRTVIGREFHFPEVIPTFLRSHLFPAPLTTLPVDPACRPPSSQGYSFPAIHVDPAGPAKSSSMTVGFADVEVLSDGDSGDENNMLEKNSVESDGTGHQNSSHQQQPQQGDEVDTLSSVLLPPKYRKAIAQTLASQMLRSLCTMPSWSGAKSTIIKETQVYLFAARHLSVMLHTPCLDGCFDFAADSLRALLQPNSDYIEDIRGLSADGLFPHVADAMGQSHGGSITAGGRYSIGATSPPTSGIDPHMRLSSPTTTALSSVGPGYQASSSPGVQLAELQNRRRLMQSRNALLVAALPALWIRYRVSWVTSANREPHRRRTADALALSEGGTGGPTNPFVTSSSALEDVLKGIQAFGRCFEWCHDALRRELKSSQVQGLAPGQAPLPPFNPQHQTGFYAAHSPRATPLPAGSAMGTRQSTVLGTSPPATSIIAAGTAPPSSLLAKSSSAIFTTPATTSGGSVPTNTNTGKQGSTPGGQSPLSLPAPPPTQPMTTTALPQSATTQPAAMGITSPHSQQSPATNPTVTALSAVVLAFSLSTKWVLADYIALASASIHNLNVGTQIAIRSQSLDAFLKWMRLLPSEFEEASMDRVLSLELAPFRKLLEPLTPTLTTGRNSRTISASQRHNSNSPSNVIDGNDDASALALLSKAISLTLSMESGSSLES